MSLVHFPLPRKGFFIIHYTATQLKSRDLQQKLACKCQQQIVYFHRVTVKRMVFLHKLPLATESPELMSIAKICQWLEMVKDEVVTCGARC